MIRFPRTIASLLAAIAFSCGSAAQAASHREAPLIALEPAADNTDVYAFVTYDAANLARPPSDRRVTFIMNVNPGQDPSDASSDMTALDNVMRVTGRSLSARELALSANSRRSCAKKLKPRMTEVKVEQT